MTTYNPVSKNETTHNTNNSSNLSTVYTPVGMLAAITRASSVINLTYNTTSKSSTSFNTTSKN